MRKNSLIAASTVFAIMLGGVLMLTDKKEERVDIIQDLSSSASAVERSSLKSRKTILDKSLTARARGTHFYKSFLDSDLTQAQMRDLIEKNPKDVKAFLENTFDSLKDCYHEGCGQEAEEEDGFFDPSLTVAQQSLKRLIKITRENNDLLGFEQWPNVESLLDLLDAENEGLRKEAFRSLLDFYGKEKAFSTILSNARSLNEDAAATSIEQLLPLINEENKQDFIDILATINKESNSATIIGILEKLENFQVTSDQLAQISDGLCRFTNDKSEAQNVRAMNYYLGTMAEESGVANSSINGCF